MHGFYKLLAVASWSFQCVCGLRAGGYLASRLPTGSVNPWAPQPRCAGLLVEMSTAAFAGLACARTRTQRKVRCPCQRPGRDSRLQDHKRKSAAVAKSRVIIASRGWQLKRSTGLGRPSKQLGAPTTGTTTTINGAAVQDARHARHARICVASHAPAAAASSSFRARPPSGPPHLHLIDRRSRSSAARDNRQPEISCQ